MPANWKAEQMEGRGWRVELHTENSLKLQRLLGGGSWAEAVSSKGAGHPPAPQRDPCRAAHGHICRLPLRRLTCVCQGNPGTGPSESGFPLTCSLALAHGSASEKSGVLNLNSTVSIWWLSGRPMHGEDTSSVCVFRVTHVQVSSLARPRSQAARCAAGPFAPGGLGCKTAFALVSLSVK